ncbi:Long-chain-fatty-acid--CoA ligase [Streptomyces tendae]
MEGEICVELDGEEGRPVGVMAGYPDDPTRTEHALGRGWYATGDLGERDPEGWIRVLGRRDDVFKSYGHRVSPFEAETVLRAHPAVADVAVVPVPDDRAGLLPLAVVVPAPGRTADAALASELLTHTAGTLSPRGTSGAAPVRGAAAPHHLGKDPRRLVRAHLPDIAGDLFTHIRPKEPAP